MTESASIEALLQRIADALERLAPAGGAEERSRRRRRLRLARRPRVARAGGERQPRRSRCCSRASTACATSCSTTRGASPQGLPANNVLLWGARGMGKSSLVKAAHADGQCREARRAGPGRDPSRGHPDPAASPHAAARHERGAASSSATISPSTSEDTSYKSLKAVLEGGIEGRPDNVVLYATSNRRHLLSRDMIENERSTAINPGEAVEEKVSLSDRFGLWLGFHACDQQTFFAMVAGLCPAFRPRLSRRQAEGRSRRNGRSPAARARAASPGNTSRISREGSARSSTEPMPDLQGSEAMATTSDYALLTRVGPGTPMGQLMRRLLDPGLRSRAKSSPTAPPLRLMLLGEKLIAFRDTTAVSASSITAARIAARRCSSAATRNVACAASITAGNSTSTAIASTCRT